MQMRQDIAHRFSVGTMLRGVENVYRTVLTGMPASDSATDLMSPATQQPYSGA